MAVIRPKDEPEVTSPTAGDKLLLDGATVRSIAVEDFYAATIASDAELAALAGVTSAADRLFYFTGAGTGALATFTAFGRSLVAAVNGPAALTTLGALPLAGGTMTGALILNADPSAALGAATKQYVDSVAQGLDPKASAVVATTANIALTGTQTIDGVAVVAGDRVLVKNQTTASQNGIYVCAAGAWARAADADAWSELPGAYLFVERGTLNADTAWTCTVDQGGTLGTTSITFTQFAGAGTYTAGTGITLTGTQYSITINGVTNALLAQGGAATLKGNPGNATGNLSDFTIQGLAALASPHATLDYVLGWDHVAGTLVRVTPGAIAASAVAGVASINGQTGALSLNVPHAGRITLQSGVPVMTTTQAGKTRIYWTPYLGDTGPIYDGTNMVPTASGEIFADTTDTTKSPAAIGANKVNDWFRWNDGGTIRIGHGPDWTNDTTRSAGTALVLVNGVLLNNAAITNGPAAQRGTFIGTTRSNGSGQLDWIYGGVGVGGSAGFLGIWNMYNRVLVTSFVGDSTDSWTYGTAAYRAANNSATFRTSYVCGLAEDAFTAMYSCTMIAGASTASYPAIAVGFNSTTVATGQQAFLLTGGSGQTAASLIANALGYGVGLNYFSALETSVSTTVCSFNGDQGAPGVTQSGIHVSGRM